MTISSIYPKETQKGVKNLSQKFILQLGTLNFHGRELMNASNGTNLVMFSYHHFFIDDMTNPLYGYNSVSKYTKWKIPQ